ncbi:MAG: phage protease [Aquisalimonadaceae bacterium]
MRHYRTAIALCHAATAHPVVALNVQLPEDGSVPEWVELIPAGEVRGRDTRGPWFNDQPDELIARSRTSGRDIPLDWEHATEIRAPRGEDAPAAAWITALENRAGAIWGQVEWTPRGRVAVANREYRYLSPVFLFDKMSRRILALTSAGLTNSPNLHLTALNRGDSADLTTDPEDAVKLPEAILKALGLKDDATADDAVAAINSTQGDLQTARNRAENPSLEKFVPRGDYDKALERATNAETKLAEQEKTRLDGEIDSAINAALKAGKITPATAEYHKAQCRQDGGLERFQEYVKAAPTVGDATDLDDRDPEAGKGKALNGEQQAVAAMFGNSAEDIQKYGQA